MNKLKLTASATTFLLALSSLHASASDIESRILDCSIITNNESRISCYDQIADGLSKVKDAPERLETESSQAKTSPSDPVQPQTVAPVATEKTTEPEALFGKSNEAVDEVVREKLKIESLDQIRSPVVKVQSDYADKLIVFLENDQVWKQKEASASWRIKVGEVAVISKASFGSFLMKAENRKKSIRAERLR
jgi:hypothetical protein